jgi:hypothetical protein
VDFFRLEIGWFTVLIYSNPHGCMSSTPRKEHAETLMALPILHMCADVYTIYQYIYICTHNIYILIYITHGT